MSNAFWDGFWSVFRYPFVIYMLGVTAGFCAAVVFGIWRVKC